MFVNRPKNINLYVFSFFVIVSSGCCFPSFYIYLFGYKMECFFFQNNPKNLDPSYKTDLDLWNGLIRVKFILQQKFIGLI